METKPEQQEITGTAELKSKNKTEEKKQVIERWRASGKSQKVFCQENNIKYNTFVSWIHIFKGQEVKNKSNLRRGFGFAAVKVASTTSAFVQVTYKDGMSVSIYQAVSADFIRSLIFR